MIEIYHKLLLDNNFSISKLPKINPANPNITHLAKTCENVSKFITPFSLKNGTLDSKKNVIAH